jgi:aminomethyltransferase
MTGTSPLDALHRSLDAKMTPFGGWEMPLSYPSGTLDEHRACRQSGVVFDVSHLGTLRVHGSGAFDLLQRVLSNDLRKVEPGRAQYTHLLDPGDASVVDDIIVWWVNEHRFDVMPNASNTSRVETALDAEGGGVDALDITATRAVLAVQGPDAKAMLASVFPEAGAVGRFRVAEVVWNGVDCVVAGTGYTGESGVEIAVPVDAAPALWETIVTAGLVPAGLGARDTLRLEAGLPLHGNELGPGITPLQAGLGWVAGWDKDDFRGRAALEAEHTTGPERLLQGLLVEGRRPPRRGQAVLHAGQPVAQVTSGNFSPMLEQGIAMALLPVDLGPGDSVQIEARRDLLDATVTSLPFISA